MVLCHALVLRRSVHTAIRRFVIVCRKIRQKALGVYCTDHILTVDVPLRETAIGEDPFALSATCEEPRTCLDLSPGGLGDMNL